MARRDRKCICCETKYKYCPTCSYDARKPAWMTEFCSEECKELWTAATKFNMNMLTKQEAKDIISELTLKDHSEYVECVQRDLRVILGGENPTTSHEVVKQEEDK